MNLKELGITNIFILMLNPLNIKILNSHHSPSYR